MQNSAAQALQRKLLRDADMQGDPPSENSSPENTPFMGYTFMEFPGTPPASNPRVANPLPPVPFTPPYPPMPVIPVTPPIQKRSSPWKRVPRGVWIMLGLVVVLLLTSVFSFLGIKYITRSTPDKTLDAFCSALLQGDYRVAYDLFSARLQHTVSEAAFAAPLVQDRVIACTHGMTDDSGNSVTNFVKLTHASQGVNNDAVSLTKGSDDSWKIDDIYRLSFSSPEYFPHDRTFPASLDPLSYNENRSVYSRGMQESLSCGNFFKTYNKN
jgi:hypothetical protein